MRARLVRLSAFRLVVVFVVFVQLDEQQVERERLSCERVVV
jgi:hypothetical protein